MQGQALFFGLVLLLSFVLIFELCGGFFWFGVLILGNLSGKISPSRGPDALILEK